ncbi:MAG: FAD-binding oxidoreductase, partial [Fimbriimonadaceae bacterium]|nr:FAD-binding oxidoreductase [Alphaproteobacteria bacterium]
AGLGGTDIAQLPADIPTPRPVKGVMLALDMDPDAPLINRLIKRPDGILCPRSDGRLLVGVTHEDGATGLTASKKDVAKLLDSAIRAVPAIKQLPLREAAVGIRSLVGDGTLRLGRSHRLQGLYYSLSHAGAGFLRAPAISQELAEFVLSDQAECPCIETFLRR